MQQYRHMHAIKFVSHNQPEFYGLLLMYVVIHTDGLGSLATMQMTLCGSIAHAVLQVYGKRKNLSPNKQNEDYHLIDDLNVST